MKQLQVTLCPNWPLLKGFGTGHWTNTYAELFGPTKDGPPTHLHINDLKFAIKAFKLGKMKLPASIVTVSYPSEPWHAPEGTEPMDLYVHRYVDQKQISLFA